VTDRIAIGVATSDKLYEAIQAMNDYIKRETLAEKITDGLLEVSDFKKKWEIGDDNCTISIRRNPN
jgi:isoleucyl-tRNA synthetase